jgi:hypothetical protein
MQFGQRLSHLLEKIRQVARGAQGFARQTAHDHGRCAKGPAVGIQEQGPRRRKADGRQVPQQLELALAGGRVGLQPVFTVASHHDRLARAVGGLQRHQVDARRDSAAHRPRPQHPAAGRKLIAQPTQRRRGQPISRYHSR